MSEHEPDYRTAPPDGRPYAEQPAWRREFPIDAPQDHYVARRDFTKFMVLTSLAFVVGQFWIVLQSWLRNRKPKPEEMLIGRLSELPVGSAQSFSYPEPQDSCLVVRLSDSKLVAYDQKCTHLSCAVMPDVGEGRLHCPCHKGVFDMETGRPIAGPPRRPLPRIELEIRGDEIYATDVERRTV